MQTGITESTESTDSADSLAAYQLRTEYATTPLGLDEPAPRFSWRLSALRRGASQRAYRVTVYLYPFISGAAQSLVWDSGWRESSDTFGLAYDGAPLASFSRYRWVLKLRDGAGREFGAGESWFEVGLLAAPDFHGEWISRDMLNWNASSYAPHDHFPSMAARRLAPARYLRGEFSLAPKTVVRARVYATAHGLYQLYLNGQRISDHELAPGWTDYNDRVLYQTFDVTAQLARGSNALGIVLGEGWWSGYIGSDRRNQGYHYGRLPEAWAQLMVEYDDGSRHIFATGAHWRDSNGPIVYSDLLMGEWIDRRRDIGDWTAPEYDAGAWVAVATRPGDFGTLRAMSDEPIRAIERIPAVSVVAHGEVLIVDFGQNISGRARIEFAGERAGTEIQIRYAEILDASGALYTENLRTAEATDLFICAGTGVEIFEPTFTSHGFRYAEISGARGDLRPAAAVAVVLRNDIAWVGSVETSDPDVNQLERNIRWGQRGNFVAVPTDCPQRDERLGWMADAQVFLRTAAYNADVAAFFSRWLRDVRYAQSSEGSYANVAPKITIMTDGAPAWGDAGVIIPWLLYRLYGDTRVLADSFESMRRWIDFLERNNPELIWNNRMGSNYGDWLEINADTPRDVLATAYFAYSTGLLSQAAAVLGDADSARRYAQLAERIRGSFCTHFVDSDFRITGDTQTVYLLAIEFDLLPASARPALAAHLVRKLADNGGNLTTGFIGVGLLCPVLCDIGREDLAYALLHKDDYPSWLYSIRQGATTIWERWDGYTLENGFQSAKMNSFNHYALGSIGEWLYRYVAGLDQAAESVAFSELSIAPRVGSTLTSARASYQTPRGLASSAWTRTGREFELAIEVPPTSTARVVVPSSADGPVLLDGTALESSESVSAIKVESDGTSFTVGSGSYRFRSLLPAG